VLNAGEKVAKQTALSSVNQNRYASKQAKAMKNGDEDIMKT